MNEWRRNVVVDGDSVLCQVSALPDRPAGSVQSRQNHGRRLANCGQTDPDTRKGEQTQEAHCELPFRASPPTPPIPRRPGCSQLTAGDSTPPTPPLPSIGRSLRTQGRLQPQDPQAQAAPKGAQLLSMLFIH